jgi:omega-6 fatty acid desaturase (delta-12 desaturase)
LIAALSVARVITKIETKGSKAVMENKKARDWAHVLSAYRHPCTYRSSFEIAATIVPFVGMWALAWWVLAYSTLLAVVIASMNSLFLVRLFCIQHDCGHGTLFKNKSTNDCIGRILGAFTLTPYEVWRRAHSIHHGASGNLMKRGIGDIDTLTVNEYQNRSRFGRLKYRLYRHPITLFIIGPAYLFFLQNRLPIGYMKNTSFWISAMATNLGILASVAVIYYFGGLAPVLFIFLPTTFLAAMIGVWLFYVQHQFEYTYWEENEEWDLHDAALHGSSHYVLPSFFQWMTANIGIHHIHHLSSRIPFYRLTKAIKDHPSLAEMNILTVKESLVQANLHLWDEEHKCLVPFSRV